MVLFFFFQAEDGIRDLVRSRGLGDVYKRQAMLLRRFPTSFRYALPIAEASASASSASCDFRGSVSYTHLTLPTIYSV